MLRDEGEAYAARLPAGGVAVTAVRYDGITHDFMMLNPLSGTHATRAAVAQAHLGPARRVLRHLMPGGKMTTPAGENAFLQELELNVRSELTIVETSEPAVDADDAPSVEWLLDPDAQRYEIGLHTLLGAVETLEYGSRDGGAPDATTRPQ